VQVMLRFLTPLFEARNAADGPTLFSDDDDDDDDDDVWKGVQCGWIV